MSRFEVVPFEPHHLGDIDPPVMTRPQLRIFAKAHRPPGPTYTALCHGRAVLCGGVRIEGDVGHAWAVLSDEARRHPVLVHRVAMRTLARAQAEHGLARLEASVHRDLVRGQRWLERLGFRPVGRAPDPLGTGEDFERYVCADVRGAFSGRRFEAQAERAAAAAPSAFDDSIRALRAAT